MKQCLLQIYDLFFFVGSVIEKDEDSSDFFARFWRDVGGKIIRFSILSVLRSLDFFSKFLIIRSVILVFLCTEIIWFGENILFKTRRCRFFRYIIPFVRPAFAQDEPFIV